MSRGSINKAILVGRLGADPEVRYTPSGAAVANFNLATNHRIKRGDDWEDATDWHRIVAWNKTAEFCKEYVKKGHRVYVEGRLQTREWETDDGQKRYTTEVVAREVQSLESREQSEVNHETAPAEPADVNDTPF